MVASSGSRLPMGLWPRVSCRASSVQTVMSRRTSSMVVPARRVNAMILRWAWPGVSIPAWWTPSKGTISSARKACVGSSSSAASVVRLMFPQAARPVVPAAAAAVAAPRIKPRRETCGGNVRGWSVVLAGVSGCWTVGSTPLSGVMGPSTFRKAIECLRELLMNALYPAQAANAAWAGYEHDSLQNGLLVGRLIMDYQMNCGD